MWMAKQTAGILPRIPAAETGVVTLSGDKLAVYDGGERRNVTICAPRGIVWRPLVGDTVVTLVPDDAGGIPCILGMTGQDGENLAPGELQLRSLGATLTLRNDGTVELTGTLKLQSEPVISGGDG